MKFPLAGHSGLSAHGNLLSQGRATGERPQDRGTHDLLQEGRASASLFPRHILEECQPWTPGRGAAKDQKFTPQRRHEERHPFATCGVPCPYEQVAFIKDTLEVKEGDWRSQQQGLLPRSIHRFTKSSTSNPPFHDPNLPMA